jgi:membrane dipeptidase
MFKIIDGHNDLLMNIWLNHPDNPAVFFTGVNGHLDFPRIKQSGLKAAIFALFVPPREYIATSHPSRAPLVDYPNNVMWQQLQLLQKIEYLSDGKAKICTSAQQIQQCIDNDVFAMIAHIEGADGLDVAGEQLAKFYQAGVRSVGPFWKNKNAYGAGVNGPFPGSPDTGPGLTQQGKELIQKLNQYQMLIDVSHMNYKAFLDTAELSSAPLVATHSCAHHLCPQPRNLTDEQLAMIAKSNGLVGVNFGNPFLRPDGQRNSDTPITAITDQILYLLDKLGEDQVGFGSDFDGVAVPNILQDVTGFQLLTDSLMAQGLSEQTMNKLCFGNWLRVLKRIWGE